MAWLFKPAGVPARDLDEVCLSMDEFEALRLADHEGLYHEDAAASMNVSRQTFGNILTSARRKVAHCLVLGIALRIEESENEVRDERGRLTCKKCGKPITGGQHHIPPCCSSGHHDEFWTRKGACGRAKKHY